MKEDNTSQFCEQQYTHGSCHISLFKFKSYFRHLLSCGTIGILFNCCTTLWYKPWCQTSGVRLKFLGGRGGNTFKTPSPYKQLRIYPLAVLRSLLKDPLMNPHHPTSSILLGRISYFV